MYKNHEHKNHLLTLLSFKFLWNTYVLSFFFCFFFFLPGFYEAKAPPDAIDLIMKSFQVIGHFKSNRKTYRPVTGDHQMTSTKSLISLELTILTRLRLVTILLGLGCKILNFPEYWTLLCCISYKDPFNDLIAVFKRGYDINPFLPNLLFWSLWNIRKPKFFWFFQGDQKRMLGRKGLTTESIKSVFLMVSSLIYKRRGELISSTNIIHIDEVKSHLPRNATLITI